MVPLYILEESGDSRLIHEFVKLKYISKKAHYRSSVFSQHSADAIMPEKNVKVLGLTRIRRGQFRERERESAIRAAVCII